MSIHRVRISLDGVWEPRWVDGLAVVRERVFGIHVGVHVELYTREPLVFRNVLDCPQFVDQLCVGELVDGEMTVWVKHLSAQEMSAVGVVEVETLSWCG